jgi:hypothetical protein
MVGFLTHCGYSHGGNGFEGLLDQFREVDLQDSADPNHGLDLKALAMAFVERYKSRKIQEGVEGPGPLPGVHHPIFRGKLRPTRAADRGRRTLPLQRIPRLYRELVQALYACGASPYVFCVNVDAVIVALLLAILWRDYRCGALSEQDLEIAAFNVFLFGRMIGTVAEIDDHLNRARNMDSRTPLDRCTFVV